jgi:protoheme IX farnesyltransferase
MLIATDGPAPWLTIVFTLLGGTIAIGGAQAMNAYIDRDLDRKMKRTRQRPIAAGRIRPGSALIFGFTLTIAAFLLMVLTVNQISALLTLGAAAYYVIVYSHILKLRTSQNIVIGGAAGAAPALIGWAAATNELSLTAFWLFAIVFVWTPPHTWALALVMKDDYKNAGVPMLPVVAGERAAAKQIFIYSLILVPITLAIAPVASLGWIYVTIATLLGIFFLALDIILMRTQSLVIARNIFAYSMLYLCLLFLAMVLDTQLQQII